MSEFELTEDDLKKHEILKRWQCAECKHETQNWSKAPEACPVCSHTTFIPIVRVGAVPATTGHEIELSYDNMDSIDAANEQEFEISEQNRDLEKLEKARR